jgi:hypothetical protein
VVSIGGIGERRQPDELSIGCAGKGLEHSIRHTFALYSRCVAAFAMRLGCLRDVFVALFALCSLCLVSQCIFAVKAL